MRFSKGLFFVVLAFAQISGLGGSSVTQADDLEYVVVDFDHPWWFNQTASLDGVNWMAPEYDDSAWGNGPGVLARESNNPFVTTRTGTTLTLGRLTYYFRTRFQFTNSSTGASLTLSNIVDDGAVFYLNGTEIGRLFLPAAPFPVSYNTLATSHEAQSFEVLTLSGPRVEENLVSGDNVLAVEVHQSGAESTDIVFGASVSARILDTNPPPALRMPSSPPSFGYSLTEAFGALRFSDPVALATPPGETNRLFVLEQAGVISVISDLAAPTRSIFLDISDRILAGGERGLLGLAFHPGYATNRQFYIFYTVSATTAQGSGPHDRLARMLVSETDPNRADEGSETVLIEQYDQAGNHNGGDLHFGPEGYLYVALGDEGGGNDQYQNSQRIDRDFFAGLLRLDVDLRPENLMPNPHPANTNNPNGEIRYRIPQDNPWVGATNFNRVPILPANLRSEFWAVGLRNPWRFSFDSASGELYLADVGQNAYEEVNLIRRGGNYGWNYREGLHGGPRGNPPAGIVFDQPILEYAHGSQTNEGFSVTGGVVYRGNLLPDLSGAYVFADYVIGNVWALRADGTNVVPFLRLVGDEGIAGFGLDPRNGDVLTADQSDDTIKRLVVDPSVVVGQALPPTLFHTGAFTNLSSLASEDAPLTPNAGVEPYEINVPFWSDGAHKNRWVSRFDTNATFDFSPDANWSFPTGTVWVKHFDLELTNGVAGSAKRLETRLLVRNSTGAYGVTYRWGGSVTNAVLVPAEGLDEEFVVNDGGTVRTQVWHYPSRAECSTCHTRVGGFALGFNTHQLNREIETPEGRTNQIGALARAGYFSQSISNLNLLPRLAAATNTAWSKEWRVRSYLAANCVQCHQPGGTGIGSWDARPNVPLSASGLIGGLLNDTQGDPSNRVVVPRSLNHSMLLTRISLRGPGQMPPLSTSVLDQEAIALFSQWITNELYFYQSFPQWQMGLFGSTNAPGGGPEDDPDRDGANNYLEWLTQTEPLRFRSFWELEGITATTDVQIGLRRIANRGFELQATSDLQDMSSWRPLDIPANRPFFAATNSLMSIELPILPGAHQFFRVRVFEP